MADRRDHNERRYDGMAKSYRSLLGLGSFGAIHRLYRALARELDVADASTLIEFGCGPATLTPHLLERLGPKGRYVGVDLSSEMIAQARKWAEDHGAENAEFVKSAVLDYSCAAPADAVVFSLSLSTMPDPKRCAEAALRALRPGGQLLILDSPYTGRRLPDFVVRAKSHAVGAVPADFPMKFLEDQLDNLRVWSHWRGVYSVISGRKPAHP